MEIGEWDDLSIHDYEMDRYLIPYVKRTRKYILDHVFLSWASSLNDSRSATGRAQPEVFVLVEVPQNQLLGHPHIMKFLISISFFTYVDIMCVQLILYVVWKNDS